VAVLVVVVVFGVLVLSYLSSVLLQGPEEEEY
jgi:hypothetical protein